jgi:hypothetical protein
MCYAPPGRPSGTSAVPASSEALSLFCPIAARRDRGPGGFPRVSGSNGCTHGAGPPGAGAAGVGNGQGGSQARAGLPAVHLTARPAGIVRVAAALGFVRSLCACGLAHLLRIPFGLERLERAQRAPKLGERAAAIAQERVEAARTVAVADHRVAEIGVVVGIPLEQLSLLAAGLGRGPQPRSGGQALGALQPPDRGDDPLRERVLQRAHRRQFLHQRRLECFKLGSALPRQHHMLCARRPCLRAFCAERALPSGVLGPFDLAPFRRLASARALGRPKQLDM